MGYKAGPHKLYSLPERRIDPLSRVYPTIVLCFLIMLLSLWVSTEYIAKALAYQPKLGAPLFGHVYAPFDSIIWNVHLDAARSSRYVGGVFTRQHYIILGGVAVAILGSMLFFRSQCARAAVASDLYGSAHWASGREIERTSLLNQDDGVYVGAWEDSGSGRIRYLRHNGPEHVIVFAPTRSGKGVGLVIPTLLSWQHSVLVNDIKGENWELTAGWRHKELGSTCLKFDPTNNDGTSVLFNPLQEIRIGTDNEVRDVQNIATMIVDPDGKGLNDHWTKTGFSLLVGTILHVLYVEPDKTLRGVAAYLADPRFDTVDQMFQNMLNAKHDPSGSKGWRDAGGSETAIHPVVAQSAKDMLNKADSEKSGVLSTAMSFLTLYRDPIVARNTESSEFKIADLMNADKPVSLYIIVPPSDKDRLKPLIRLIINQTVRALAQRLTFVDGKSVSTYKHQLLLMIDEFPALGRLDVLQEALAFLAGYGIKAYLISQDLSQLYSAYGREESIMANCNIRIAFAPNKVETADVISRTAGSATVRNPTRSYSGSRMSTLMHVATSELEVMRPLLTPDEAMRLPVEDALIFVAGHPPIYGKKIRYYLDPTFSERARISPPTRIPRSGPDPANAREDFAIKHTQPGRR
ncbi:MAG: type IV secretory system conjugative DNA transfer family protein [Candidatus Eremiobacteraeota bacterium]|nr:type IV secretory system conjugative DNA transfer family protein [Candidatus Eremiobacteraeota bacterium]